MAGQVVEETLKQKNHAISLKEISEISPPDLNTYDAIIFASPSWEVGGKDGQPHENFFLFMQKIQGTKFAGKKFGVFGLGDRSYPTFCGAVDHLEKIVADLGGSLIIPSLRIDGYFFNQAVHDESLKKWADDFSQKLTS